MNHEQEIDARERLTRLWREAEPSVQAYVFATVRSVHDAEDVVQQVAMTVARRFDEYDRSRPFVAWALWFAKSRVIDHYRRQERERLIFSESLLERLAEALIQQQPQRCTRQEALERCIEKLPEKSRQLLERRYADDASMASVAEAVQSTVASVRVMLYRIRNLLAECVQLELSRET